MLDRIRGTDPVTRADITGYQLTARETDVPSLIGAGLNNDEIARQLHLSMSTVKTHVANVLAKTGSRDRVRAAIQPSRPAFRRDDDRSRSMRPAGQ